MGLLSVSQSTFSQSAPTSKYVTGDFHQHTTYTDGSYSFAHMMAKNSEYGLEWWANSEHGGAFDRDGRVSGIDLDTTVYWEGYSPKPMLGDSAARSGHHAMWRWQMLRDWEFGQLQEARLAYPGRLILQSYEWNVPGHEHASVGLIAGQFADSAHCGPLAEFEYMFDGSDKDTTGGAAQGWSKSGLSGHAKTLEAISWLQANYPAESYVVAAHPERKRKYTISDFRDMNTAGPDVCFGFESMPGHQKSSGRGGYSSSADGGGTFGGCGIYAAEVGGLWDAMLSEGRRFWLFASSDFHSESGDFYPGEYQKTYTYVDDNSDASSVVAGLRSGNSWIVEGDLVDSLIFRVSSSSDAGLVAGMGQKLELSDGGVEVYIRVRDPEGENNNTYSDYTSPVLHHLDLIMGRVGGMLDTSDSRYGVDTVATTSVVARFDADGLSVDAGGLRSTAWSDLGGGWKEMTFRLDNLTDSVYFRLRATNMALGVSNETDYYGNPLPDSRIGKNDAAKAFADLWMYSNPVFVSRTEIPLEGVFIGMPELKLFAGRSAVIPAGVLPQNATEQALVWKSLDESVASVSGGFLAAHSAGAAEIVVMSADSLFADTCIVRVVEPSSKYVTGDFHQHTTYTDGSYSFAHMMAKNSEYGLEWWANSEHGGAFDRDGRVSGIDLDTTVYWEGYSPKPMLGDSAARGGHHAMWRWQMLHDWEFGQLQEARLAYPGRLILQSYEWNVPGHEHASVGLIAGQFADSAHCGPLAEFEYMFDNSDRDTTGGAVQGWSKSGLSGHAKTLEAISWLQANYPAESYVVAAHPERKRKYTISDFRDMNTAGPDVCFGFESMPGHQKSSGRGGYSSSADGGGTFGGCGIYAAEVGGLWDAMLSEGRRFWLFASSDFHSESGDFYPGEYQKTYTYVDDNSDAASVVAGLRSGNSWVVEGDLVDSLIFRVSSSSDAGLVAGMGQKLELSDGGVEVYIRVRDPEGENNNTYSDYTSPVLHHLDLIMGRVGGMLDTSDSRYGVDTVATTSVVARFDADGLSVDAGGLRSTAWSDLGGGWKEMTFRLDNLTDSVYFRLRATNMALGVSNETDYYGNPLPDSLMGKNNAAKAFADLWMYSNPVFVDQTGVFSESVQISVDTLNVFVDSETKLFATIMPDSATVKTVSWRSLDSNIVSVDSGLVYAKRAGSTFVVVTTDDMDFSDTCLVNVTVPAKTISLSESNADLYVLQSIYLTATIDPDSTTHKKLIWTSSDSTVATVINGMVQAQSEGQARIRVVVENDTLWSECVISVTGFTDVEEKEAEMVTVYPVPATDKLTVECKAAQKIEKIQLVSATGALIRSYWPNSEAVSLDLTGFLSGVYHLRISIGNKIVSRQFVLKR